MKQIKLQIRDVSYYVQVAGKGQPIVLLHGFSGDVHTWTWIQNALAKTYQVVALDILGHGKTDSPKDHTRYQMEEVIQDLREIFQKLNLTDVYLLGYSMGGRLALAFSLAYPEKVKHLILESSSPGLKTDAKRRERKAHDEWLARNILENGMAWFVAYWRDVPIFSSTSLNDKEKEARLERFYTQQKKASPIGLANSLFGMGTGMQESYWNQLAQISFQTTLICGTNDEKFCTINKDMQKHIPNAEIFFIDDAGHRVHLEQPTRFLQLVEQQIQKL